MFTYVVVGLLIGLLSSFLLLWACCRDRDDVPGEGGMIVVAYSCVILPVTLVSGACIGVACKIFLG